MSKAKKSKTKKTSAKTRATKVDLINAVMADAKDGDVVSKAQVERIVNSVFDNIVKLVDSNDNLCIYQFGVFRKTRQKARSFTTPRGDIVEKPDCDRLTFKVSSAVTKSLND